MLPGCAIRTLKIAMRTAHPHDLPGSLSPTTLLPLTTVLRFSLRVGRNGKRYRHHHPASRPWGRLAGTYPYNSKQSNPASCAATRLQLRCNPGSHRNVRTRLEIPPNPLRVRIVAAMPRPLPLATIFWDSVFFHRICILAGPMETPLCKISF